MSKPIFDQAILCRISDIFCIGFLIVSCTFLGASAYNVHEKYKALKETMEHTWIHDPNCAKCKEIKSSSERIPEAEMKEFVK